MEATTKTDVERQQLQYEMGDRLQGTAIGAVGMMHLIEELKRRPAPAETPVLFHYDPNEPLHFVPKTEKNPGDKL